MIRVTARDEPTDFDAKVRQPGLRWLREKLGGERAPRPGRPVVPVGGLKSSEVNDFWVACLPDLKSKYEGCCAYAGIEIREGGETVDHFVSKMRCLADDSMHRLIYEWTNYRYAFHRVNAAKGEKQVLDPFETDDAWFVLEFAGLQVLPAPGLEVAQYARLQATINDLGLNHAWLVALRVEYFGSWEVGEIHPSYLRRHAPFIAREIERQQIVPIVAPI